MTLSIWCGARPQRPAQLAVLAELHRALDAQPEHYTALMNFYASANDEVELVVIKSQGIFVGKIAELSGPITATSEQDWTTTLADGGQRTQANPFRPLRRNYWDVKEWLRRNAEAICGRPDRAAVMNWRAARSFVVGTPALHPNTLRPADEHSIFLGLDTWIVELQRRRQMGLDLTREELSRIPLLLHLQPFELPSSAPSATLAPLDYVHQLVARGHGVGPAVFNIAKSVIRVGRDRGNDLVLDDPTVSNQHAEIRQVGQSLMITDLGSNSGSFLAAPEQPASELAIRTPNILRSGAVVRFGSVRFTVIAH